MSEYKGVKVSALDTNQVGAILRFVGTRPFKYQPDSFYTRIVEIGTPQGNVNVPGGRASARAEFAKANTYRAAQRLYQEAQMVSSRQKLPADEASALRTLDEIAMESPAENAREFINTFYSGLEEPLTPELLPYFR